MSATTLPSSAAPLSDADRSTVQALAASLLPLSTSQAEKLRILFAGVSK